MPEKVFRVALFVVIVALFVGHYEIETHIKWIKMEHTMLIEGCGLTFFKLIEQLRN